MKMNPQGLRYVTSWSYRHIDYVHGRSSELERKRQERLQKLMSTTTANMRTRMTISIIIQHHHDP